MLLYFITGNDGKFSEASKIISDLKRLNIDLPEIQEIDARKIIQAKINHALDHAPTKERASFVVEDISLYLDCLNGLPGPLIKWFLATMGNQGLVKIAQKFGNANATARAIIGYAQTPDKIKYFDAEIKGMIVSPKGSRGFGWDPIFQPKGYAKTFAQMSQTEKNSISMRQSVFRHLRKHIQ